jgi:hypothetical protein
MDQQAEPINRRVFEAAELMAKHPPVWGHPNKQVVFEISSPPGSIHEGKLVFSRWSPLPLPERTEPAATIRRVEGREDAYDYVSVPASAGSVEWHVNFADPHLFVAYGSSLFAQDEMQVVEHPALGALREVLDAEVLHAVTVETGRPTPVLVAGIERRCRVAPIATSPRAALMACMGTHSGAPMRAPCDKPRLVSILQLSRT